VLFDAPVILLRSPARDAATNMACDDAMRHAAREHDVTIVRLYTWTEPSLSLGRHQRTVGHYSAERCADRGIPVVRRPTGGRALLHSRELTYAVAAPVRRAPDLRSAYAEINAWLTAGLRALDVSPVPAAPASRLAPPGLAPCFAEPAAGELVVDGAKLVGSAQVRDEETLLQHGSILLANDQPILESLTLSPLPPLPVPATLTDSLQRTVSSDEVTESLVDALQATESRIDAPSNDLDWLGPPVNVALLRYRDAAWTWCR
jgi:lipoyl(octanoyl) transferase